MNQPLQTQMKGLADTRPRLVRDLMSPDPETLDRNDRLSIADEVMKMKRIRHLPVLDESGRLAGILSQRDLFFNALLRALGFGTYAKEKTLEELRVKECMTENVLTISPDDTLTEASRLMSDNKIGCLPVVDKGELVGILTETDFVAAWATD